LIFFPIYLYLFSIWINFSFYLYLDMPRYYTRAVTAAAAAAARPDTPPLVIDEYMHAPVEGLCC
jgi:hypothetical protein